MWLKQTRQVLAEYQGYPNNGISEQCYRMWGKTTVFLVDMNDFAAMNAVYASILIGQLLSGLCVRVSRLPKDVLMRLTVLRLRC